MSFAELMIKTPAHDCTVAMGTSFVLASAPKHFIFEVKGHDKRMDAKSQKTIPVYKLTRSDGLEFSSDAIGINTLFFCNEAQPVSPAL